MKSFKAFLGESKVHSHYDHFVDFACEHLGIKDKPEINLVNSKKHAQEHKSFGGYYPGLKKINVNIAGRHPADVYRTLAHELVHHKQNIDERLVDGAGDTGSDIENEANAQAAIIMRNYGKAVPSIYESVQLDEIVYNGVKKNERFHTELGKHVPKDAQHIGTLDNGHHVFHKHGSSTETNHYYVADPKTKRSNLALTTHQPKKEKAERIVYLSGNKQSLGAHHLYTHLVTKHNKILTGEDQSEGARAVWAKAAKHPKVRVHGYDPDTNTAVHHDPKDDENYVSSSYAHRAGKDWDEAESDHDIEKHHKDYNERERERRIVAVMHRK